MKFSVFIILPILFAAGPAHAKLEDYLKHTEKNKPTQDQIKYVERLGDSFIRYVVIENNTVTLDADEGDYFMEDYEASTTLTDMFNSLNTTNATVLAKALQVGNVVSTYMSSVLKDYASSVDSLSYDYDKKVIVQVVWWLKQEGQVALGKKLAALEELKSKGNVTAESSKTADDMDRACIQGWGSYSAYYYKFDVDQPDSKRVVCYNGSASRSEDELYTVDLLTTLFTEMVSVQEPNCGHVDYAVSFPKAHLSGMKWALRVFSGFHEPDMNVKVKKAGEHIGMFAGKAIEKYKKHDVKGYLTDLKNANDKLQQILTDLDKCVEKTKEEEMVEYSYSASASTDSDEKMAGSGIARDVRSRA